MATEYVEDTLTQYPNLARIVNAMNPQTQTLAFMYLSILPAELIAQLDANVPAIVELNETNDEAGLVELIKAFGADDATATALVEMRHNAEVSE